MADNHEHDDDQQNGDNQGGTDYKALYEKTLAESRKWEERSKANVQKAQKYDELTAGEQSVEDRIAALEAANTQLENEKTRSELVKSVAKETGVPEAIVSTLSATDKEGLTAQAKAVAEAYKVPGGAPRVPEAGKMHRGQESDDEKRKFVRDLLGRANQ